MHFASNAAFLSLFLICLGPSCGCCQTLPYTVLVSGSNDTTVTVGENLTLTCNVSDPVSHDMIWTVNTTVQIGHCRNGGVCHSFDNSKFCLEHQDQQVFTLGIINVTVSDAGLYRFGLGAPYYLNLYAVQVHVKTNFGPISGKSTCFYLFSITDDFRFHTRYVKFFGP